MQAHWIYHSPFGNAPILQIQSQNFAGLGHSLTVSARNAVQRTPATQYNKQRNLADF